MVRRALSLCANLPTARADIPCCVCRSPSYGLQLFVNGTIIATAVTNDVKAASLPFADGCLLVGGYQGVQLPCAATVLWLAGVYILGCPRMPAGSSCSAIANNTAFLGLLAYVSVWDTVLPPDVVSSFMNDPVQVSLAGLSTADG